MPYWDILCRLGIYISKLAVIIEAHNYTSCNIQYKIL